MKIMHLLVSGNVGGIERLCLDISKNSKQENHFCFVWEGGEIAKLISESTDNILIGQFNYLSFFTEYKKIRSYCNKHSIDTIIVHHTTYILWLYGMFLQKDIGCKLFVYAHSNAKYFLHVNEGIRGFLYQRIFKIIYKKCDRVIAISDSVKKSINTYIGRDDRVTICYNGIDIERFQFLNKQKYDDTIIYIGRLVHSKGVDVLLDAISTMEKRVKLIIVGDGSEMSILKNKCEQMHLTEKVTFTGSQINIIEWLKQATVFVHPSICEEGFGITLIESMALGVPCVAYEKGAIPEIIDDGYDGFLVKNFDVKSLANKLDEIFASVNNRDWDNIRKNARNKAENFSIEKMIIKLEYILKNEY